MATVTYSLSLGDTLLVDSVGVGHQWAPAVAAALNPPSPFVGSLPPVDQVYFAYDNLGFAQIAGHAYDYGDNGTLSTTEQSYTVTPEAGNQLQADVAIGAGIALGQEILYTLVAYTDAGSHDILYKFVGPSGYYGASPLAGPTGDTGGEFPFNADDLDPAVAAIGDGKFVIAGQSIISSTDSNIIFKIVNYAGTVLEYVLASPDVPGQPTYDEKPAIARDGGFSNFYIAWDRSAPGDQDVYFRRYLNDGTPLSGAIQVNDTLDTSETVATNTAIATSATTGYVAVAWESNAWSGLADLDITARILDPAGIPITDAFRVNQTTLQDQTTPSVTSLSDGNFLFTWASGLASCNRDIYARLFSPTGAALTDEIVLASSVHREDYPDVAALMQGGAIVAWEHFFNGSVGSPDGSDSAVEARIVTATRTTVGDDQPAGVEFLGTDDDMMDVIRGQGGDDALMGYAGRDTLYGDAANDTLDGGLGADTLFGGEGDDILNGGANESADDETGIFLHYADAAFGEGGNDRYIVRGGADSFDGGSGNDTLDFSAVVGQDGGVTFSLALQGTVQAIPSGSVNATGVENLIGGIENDTLTGDGEANVLEGGAGADALGGGAGDDTYVNPTGDSVTEAAGAAGGTHDLVLSNVSYNLAAAPNVEDITLTGAANVNAIGGTGNNRLTGNAGNNTLNGGGGNDFLIGLGGADTLNGGAGNDVYVSPIVGIDTINEAAGAAGGLHDRIQTLSSFNISTVANVEDVTLVGAANVNAIGNNLDNILIGNGGANTLNGGGGADTLTGGGGNDTMNGGNGADLFRFAAAGTGADRIDAFSTAQDRFDLSGGLFANRTEAGGSTTLTHAGGTILVTGVAGLSLTQWNALVVNGARQAHAPHDDAFAYGHTARNDDGHAGLLGQTLHNFHPDLAFA